jgi:hypothetical protein
MKVALAGGDFERTAGRLIRERTPFAANHKPEQAAAFRAFERLHLVPVPDRRHAGERPLDVAGNTNGFGVHGG